jgi:predicted patatin/cPLA2 family phospholipase
MHCKYCGITINYSGKGRPRKYCENCAREKRKRYLRWYYRKYKILGTTSIKEHRRKTWEEEQEEIEKEYRKLKIKRNFIKP